LSSRDFQRRLPGAPGTTRPGELGLFHLDPLLLFALLAVIGYGLVVLYSAVNQNERVFLSQLARLGLGLLVLLVIAQLPPRLFLRWTPLAYGAGCLLLLLVLILGVKVKGSQRWLEIPGLLRFQPSEVMKLAVPMMVAWYLHDRPLPPSLTDVLYALGIIALPAGLIVLQPDLGTGILVAAAGFSVLLFAGIYWRWLFVAAVSLTALAPLLWMGLQDYQRQRILTLLDPQSDPLGAGWNIIQSTTAIGSGGLSGKGLFQGTQSHLEFLPESQTDFIIAVIGEELGFFGILLLLILYLVIIGRCLIIAAQASLAFDRLLAGALTLTFFVYLFVNIAMVTGLLPVVGVPLPLISYGGTSALTLLAGFGILMSIRTHRPW
jgi:rod shape determining protein RodA